MGRSTLTLGPFVGGLNNAAATPDTIADDELFSCVDFDYNIDGTLVTRPPVSREPVTSNINIDGFFFNVLGFFVEPATQLVYCLATINGKLYQRQNSTSFVDATAWTLISAISPVAGVQYVDNFYMAKSTAGGWKWSPGGGLTALAAVPAATSMVVFKERVWSCNGTSARLSFSDIATGDTWPVINFIDIGAGDGQHLNALYAGPSALYLFKSGSTYVLTYDSAPTRGYVQTISTTIGCLDSKGVTAYEGIIFVLHANLVYRLSGYSFSRLNIKVVIDRGVTGAGFVQISALSTVGDRIIVSFENNTYIYYPLTNTWTQWDLPATGKWFQVPLSVKKYGYKIAIAPYNGNAYTGGGLLSIQDKVWDSSLPADILSSDPTFITKLYNLDSPQTFKRLHWWGIDAIVTSHTKNAYVAMTAAPSSLDTFFTWQDVKDTYTWGTIGALTWGTLSAASTITDMLVRVVDNARKYIKADKSMRFQRIQFKIQLVDYDHTATSSVSHIVADISTKQDPVTVSGGARV